MADIDNQKFLLHEVLKPRHLQSLEEHFATIKSLKVSHREFNFNEFLEIMNTYIKPNMKLSELEDIFTRLDYASAGVSTWSSFLLYLQNEIEIKNQTTMIGSNVEAAVSENIKIIHTPIHDDPICRIDAMPLNSVTEKELANPRYATISKEGTLAVWSPSWNLNKSTNINNPMPLFRKVKTLLLDMVAMPNVNLIGISCSDDCVRFFDSYNLDVVFILNGFIATVVAMSYWFDYLEPNVGILLLGDNVGSVTVMNFTDCIVSNAFGPNPSKSRIQTVSIQEIMGGSKSYIKVIKYKHLHCDWVKQLRYEPFLKSVMSCSSTSQHSLVLIRQGLLAHAKEDWIFNVPRGINCFDFNPLNNLLATGGIDRLIRVWNPYITTKPMMSFVGHGSPVTYLSFPDDMIFSISADRILKVWDTKKEKSIQNLPLKMPCGSPANSSVYYNTYKRIFFVAGNNVCVIHRLSRECDLLNTNVDVFVSHPTPVSGLVYSKLYNQIVSVCQYGLITVWDLYSGHRILQIQRAHFNLHDGVEIPVGISAVCLNNTGKMLITCGLDGYVKIWNLGSGCMLINSVIIPDKNILTMTSINEFIYFAGWSKRIYSCDISQEALKINIWKMHHTDDITSIGCLANSVLVSCSWDGHICTWHKENDLTQSLTLSQFLAQGTDQHDSHFKGKSTITLKSVRSPTNIIRHQNIQKPVSTKSKSHKPHVRSATPERSSPCVCVLCLQNRAAKPRVGNIFVADILGRIQVWSSNCPSSALAVFASVTSEHHYTTCMTTDSQNKYLVTGDSNGFIRIWYIRYYCIDALHLKGPPRILRCANPEIRKFPFCRHKLRKVAEKTEKKLKFLTPNDLAGHLEVDHPLLLSTYQAHIRSITKIVLIESSEMIITCSNDQSVRLWTLHGRFIGIFGDPRGWDLIKMITPPIKSKDRKIPEDVRRVTSATTLQVMFSGLSRRWWKIREHFLTNYLRGILKKRKLNATREKESEVITVRAPSLAARKMSRKIIATTKYGPPLGEHFHISKTSPPELALIPPQEEINRSLTVIHKYIPCYELENISLSKSQRIVNSVSTEKKSRSRTFSVATLESTGLSAKGHKSENKE